LVVLPPFSRQQPSDNQRTRAQHLSSSKSAFSSTASTTLLWHRLLPMRNASMNFVTPGSLGASPVETRESGTLPSRIFHLGERSLLRTYRIAGNGYSCSHTGASKVVHFGTSFAPHFHVHALSQRSCAATSSNQNQNFIGLSTGWPMWCVVTLPRACGVPGAG
jgi:hypothetical protein